MTLGVMQCASSHRMVTHSVGINLKQLNC